jgi:hypothetical protein
VVVIVMTGIPVSALHSFNERRRYAVSGGSLSTQTSLGTRQAVRV